MPRTEVKKHWLLGPRLKTLYTDRDRMLLAMGKKLGIKNILEIGPSVTKVLVGEHGEVDELRFILDDPRGTPKHFGLIYSFNGLVDMEYSDDAGNFWGRIETWYNRPDNTVILMRITQ